MNGKWLAALGFFCLIQPSRIVAAETIDAVKLRDYCQLVGLDDTQLNDDKIYHATICLFYVEGIAEGYEAAGPKTKLVCIPDSVSNGQMALVVSKYLNDNPDMLNNPPRFLVLDALSKAFPCSASPQRK